MSNSEGFSEDQSDDCDDSDDEDDEDYDEQEDDFEADQSGCSCPHIGPDNISKYEIVEINSRNSGFLMDENTNSYSMR